MTRPDRTSVAGARYLDLQRKARQSGRPTDELIQLYALECFLDRLTQSAFAKKLVLKGGVLLAALDARRPTRDIDLAASALRNTETEVLAVVREIAGISLNDGVEFDPEGAAAEVIRAEADYSGIRVTLDGTLSRATVSLHVDVNVGDPIWPEPQQVSVPRLLDGVLHVRGYPLEMVLAEKVATAIARGIANTRWRDFVDLYALAMRHPVSGATFRASLDRVVEYRKLTLMPLASVLAGYSELAQARWVAWLRKQRLESTIPTEFSAVLDFVVAFADPIISRQVTDSGTWHPQQRRWRMVRA
jgi:predicted nucleotidyltransferase component of viral defense system